MRTWKEILAQDPDHSERYAARWKNFVAEGRDIDGEARMLDAMAARGARILDAGCGTGRVGGVLAARGHHVTGVDIDPVLIGHAKTDFPACDWHVGDLCAGENQYPPEDLIFTAGNVFWFLPTDGRIPALKCLGAQLSAGGRLVIAFGRGRGYEFEDFFADVTAAGLKVDIAFGSWNGHSFHLDTSEYLVATLVRM